MLIVRSWIVASDHHYVISVLLLVKVCALARHLEVCASRLVQICLMLCYRQDEKGLPSTP